MSKNAPKRNQIHASLSVLVPQGLHNSVSPPDATILLQRWLSSCNKSTKIASPSALVSKPQKLFWPSTSQKHCKPSRLPLHCSSMLSKLSKVTPSFNSCALPAFIALPAPQAHITAPKVVKSCNNKDHHNKSPKQIAESNPKLPQASIAL
jgi:hypothetical protein